MVKRKIIKIDEDKCNGCGLCVPNCAEGAIKIIDGKARLAGDFLCDGLGACLGTCPKGAITIEERDAQMFDENKVKTHKHDHAAGGCPGSKVMDFRNKENKNDESGIRGSELRQWPVQLHLVGPQAAYFQKVDVLLSADCVAYAVGDFHKDYLKGKSLVIACPKLDDGLDTYVEKITSLIDDSKINTLTVITMQVPCCAGLVEIARQGLAAAKRKIPIKSIVVSLQGEILSEDWVS